MNEEKVILVNEKDEIKGYEEKIEAHRKGLLHRAFSVFIFNTKGEMLLQKRAAGKYHSGGLWSNACCGHPRQDEETSDAAKRRLKEEMGFETPLKKFFDLVYTARLDNGLSEHEFDHVFIGRYDGLITANPDEVNDFCYKKISAINESMHLNPNQFTVWFQLLLPKAEQWLLQQD